jgi:hypothetical protein
MPEQNGSAERDELEPRADNPEPILVDGEEEWFLDSILAHKIEYKWGTWSLSYYGRWHGGPQYDSWEPAEDMEDTEALDIYLSNHTVEPPPHGPSRKN